MCIHYTHVQFGCGHRVEAIQTGRDYIRPTYCDRVKQALDWYHTQPDRKPEPVPVPPPRPCQLFDGNKLFAGNRYMIMQKTPCALCVTLGGLTGINALQDQKMETRQEQSRSKRKRKWNKGKQSPAGNYQWVWKSGVGSNGDNWQGVEKVRVRIWSGQSKNTAEASPATSRTEASVGADHAGMVSPTQAAAGNEASLSPEAPIMTPPVAPLPELDAATGSFMYSQELARRGIAMFTDYPDSRLAFPQGMVPNGPITTFTAPPDPSVLSMGAYNTQAPIFVPGNSFYPPLAPHIYYEMPTVPEEPVGPVYLPDGTVECPRWDQDDEFECFREAFADHTQPPAEILMSLSNGRACPTQPRTSVAPQDSEQQPVEFDPKWHAGSPRPISRVLELQKEDAKVGRRHSSQEAKTSLSPVIVSSRRVSEGDSPTSFLAEAVSADH
ncbi:hypothetical protein MMC10_003455 [Thelotrema lepadinum]|nr:hypothetical protein [Thelotrema lepadinum]